MITRLNGISFVNLPHITSGTEVYAVRETGELWDSDARPAYSVRLDGLHLGYIPLVETIKEEALKAKYDKLRKVWRKGMEDLTPDQLRKIAISLNEKGELEHFRDWEPTDDETARRIAYSKMKEAEVVEQVRDWLYIEIARNMMTPFGTILPTYYDQKHGRNYEEIGDVCSLSVSFDMDACNPLATQGSAAMEAFKASRHDQS